MRKVLALMAILLVSLTAACGDDGQGDTTPTPSNRASDEEYLRVVCSGTEGFSNALVSQTSAEGIAKSIKDFIAALKEIAPPADLDQFHKDLVKYLEDSVADPTSLITKKRPQPSDKVRDRLAQKEGTVTECAKAHYFVKE